jgi:hypothetical protein
MTATVPPLSTFAPPAPAVVPEAAPAPAAAPVFKAGRPINRYELKYFVPVTMIPVLAREMAAYTRPDPHDVDGKGYRVYSVYWDSPDFQFFWEKIEGYSHRRKLRFRVYGDSPNAFIEIKQRFDRTLQKLRLAVPIAGAPRFFDDEREGRFDDAMLASPVTREILEIKHRYNLMPRMAVSYRRRALFGEFSPDLRVTFDTRIQYSDAHLDLREQFDTGKYVIDPRLTVMEVKFSDRVPTWLVKLIRRHELQITRMSKYCSAVDKEYHGGQLAPLI